jgi:hypothetical protein
VPWSELDQFLRQDNVLELRSILAATAACGRQWAPAHAVPPGSVIELSEQELSLIAASEHARWQARRVAAGRIHEYTVPLHELQPQVRVEVREHLRTQLAQLEDVGFVPIVPAGGPTDAAVYERVGRVQAGRLSGPLAWTTHAGDQMHGQAGDWRVVDEAGNVRTVTDSDFQSSHEPADAGRWRRVGTYRAWQVREEVVVRTKEGRATARVADWIVEAPSGERWPVRSSQFQWSYRPVPNPPDHPVPPTGQARRQAPGRFARAVGGRAIQACQGIAGRVRLITGRGPRLLSRRPDT